MVRVHSKFGQRGNYETREYCKRMSREPVCLRMFYKFLFDVRDRWYTPASSDNRMV